MCKKMKVYKCYLDCGETCSRVIIPAYSEKEVVEYVAGNGEVISVKETTDYPISEDKVREALRKSSFGGSEIDIITRALYQLGLAE